MFGRPEPTLCGSQDVKIQLRGNYLCRPVSFSIIVYSLSQTLSESMFVKRTEADFYLWFDEICSALTWPSSLIVRYHI